MWERRLKDLAAAPGHELCEGLGLSADLAGEVSAAFMTILDNNRVKATGKRRRPRVGRPL